MYVLVTWLLMGVLGMVAVGFATYRVARTWNLPGMPYLTVYMAATTLYHALIAILALRTILLYTGAAVGIGAIILTIAQLIVTLPAMAFAAFLLGLVGQKEDM